MNIPSGIVSLLGLACSMFFAACTTLSEQGNAALLSQSYDVPGTLEPNAVISSVERAFARTLAVPVHLEEGQVRWPLQERPSSFVAESRRLYLDRLGTINAPKVLCPDSMATMHAVVINPHASSLYRYTSCVQLYASGYRISIVQTTMAVEGHDGDHRGLQGKTDSLADIGRLVQELIPDARLVSIQNAGGPVTAQANSPDGGAVRALPSEAAADLAKAVSAVPFVCLTPKRESAVVRAGRGEGGIISRLHSQSIVPVIESVDTTYFPVETEAGAKGWISREEVNRLPCPIG